MPEVTIWDEEEGRPVTVWEEDAPAQPAQVAPPQSASAPGWLQQLQESEQQRLNLAKTGALTNAPQFLGNIGAGTVLPAAGTIIGGRFGGAPGAAMGGTLGETLNQAIGITPRSNLAIALSALPGPGARGVVAASKPVDALKRTVSGMNPALGAGLAEEALGTTRKTIGKMNPIGTTADKEYAILRNMPEYKQSNINLTESARVGQEEARILADIEASRPGLAREYSKAASVSEVSNPIVSPENAHNQLMAINKLLDSPSLEGPVKGALKQSRAAIYRDLMASPISPQLRKASETYARETAVNDLQKVVDATKRTKGEIQGVRADQLVENLRRTYEQDEFMQAAINPIEFTSLLSDIQKFGVEQAKTAGNVGSLALYGGVAGGGGGLGAAASEAVGMSPGPSGLLGSMLGMAGLRNWQEKQVGQAFSKGGAAKRQAAVQRFRTPPQPMNIDPRMLETIGQGGVQSIAEMFLRNQRINPIDLQPEVEER